MKKVLFVLVVVFMALGAAEYAGAVDATVSLKPDVIGPRGGKWLTCFIKLPEGYDVADIDVSTVALWHFTSPPVVNAELKPAPVIKGGTVRKVRFLRSEVYDVLQLGPHKLKITGEVAGEYFDGWATLEKVE